MTTSRHLFCVAATLCITGTLLANNGGGKPPGKLEGSVYGYVVDANTRKPVSGVSVLASPVGETKGRAMQSDASGFFQFSKLPAGEIALQFEKKGYRMVRKDIFYLREGMTLKLSVEFRVAETDDDSTDMWHPLFKMLQ